MPKIDTQGRKIHRDETIIEQLTYETSTLKRHKFAECSEQISPARGSLRDDLINTIEVIDAELKALLQHLPRQNHASNLSVRRCRSSRAP